MVWLLVGLLPELVGGWGQIDKSWFGWLGRSTVSPLGYISLGKVGLAGSGSQERTGPRLDVIDAMYFRVLNKQSVILFCAQDVTYGLHVIADNY